MTKDTEQRKKAAIKEFQATCEKYDVNIVPYIDTLGPKLAVVANDEKSKNETPGNDASEGAGAPSTDDKRVGRLTKNLPSDSPVSDS